MVVSKGTDIMKHLGDTMQTLNTVLARSGTRRLPFVSKAERILEDANFQMKRMSYVQEMVDWKSRKNYSIAMESVF